MDQVSRNESGADTGKCVGGFEKVDDLRAEIARLQMENESLKARLGGCIH